MEISDNKSSELLSSKVTQPNSSGEKYYVECRATTFSRPPKNDEINKIQTSKYTWYNCIPKILFEQFSKMSNIYFLIIAVFQCFKEISNANGRPIILMPLAIIVAVNGVKIFFIYF